MTRLGPTRTKILLLILHAADEGRHETIRSLGRAVGIGTTNGVMCHLKPLRRHGFVTWDDGLSGTIRPTCRALALPPASPHEVKS